MPTDRKFDLGDYVQVKDRLAAFYELYANGRIVTAKVKVTAEPDGVPRVWVKAYAYRTPDDPQPAVGWSWMQLPGTTNYTRGSELENTETSAWGRAIAALGILVDKSIASAQEVQNKQGTPRKGAGFVSDAPFNDEQSVTNRRQPLEAYIETGPHTRAPLPANHDPGGIVGVIAESKDSPDFMPTPGPDGPVLTFKLVTNGKGGGIKAIAYGPLAEQLADVGSKGAIGVRITAWGRVKDEQFTNRKGTVITYQVLDLTRVTGPFGDLPMTDAELGIPDHAGSAVAEGQETFDLSEEGLT